MSTTTTTDFKLVNRLYSYPIVQDGVTTIQQNINSTDIGRRTASSLSTAFDSVATSPSIRPYLAKADNIVDSGLGQLEERFPIVKQSTKEIVSQPVEFAKSTVDAYGPAVHSRIDPIIGWMVPWIKYTLDTIIPPPKGEVNGVVDDHHAQPPLEACKTMAGTAYTRLHTYSNEAMKTPVFSKVMDGVYATIGTFHTVDASVRVVYVKTWETMAGLYEYAMGHIHQATGQAKQAADQAKHVAGQAVSDGGKYAQDVVDSTRAQVDEAMKNGVGKFQSGFSKVSSADGVKKRG